MLGAIDAGLIQLLRATYPELLAREIIGSQPIDPFIGKEILDAASTMTEEELEANGYRPLCPTTRLLWIKD